VAASAAGDRPADAVAMTRGWWTACAVALGVFAAVLSTYPLAARVQDSVVTWREEDTALADVLLTLWILDEGGRRLYTDPLRVFEGNAYHPMRHSLLYSESMLSAGALVAPVNALTGNPVLGYNLYYLTTVVLSLVGTFLVVREITGDPRAGLVGGWLFALCADRLWFGGFLPSLSVHWVPFVIYAWLRLLDAPGPRPALGLAAALVMHMHASAYHGLMLPVLLVPWALALLVLGPWPLRRWATVAAALVPGLGISLALFVPYLAVRDEFQRFPKGMVGIQDRWYWGAFLDPVAYVRGVLSGPRALMGPSSPAARALGVAATSPLPPLLLAAAGLAMAWRRPLVRRPRGEGAHVVALAAFTLAAMAVSLGSSVSIPGVVENAAPPFAYLHLLPGFASMRVQRRFLLLAAFGTSALAGVATAVLLRRLRSRLGQAALVLGLLAVVVVDTRTLRAPLPLTRLPPPAEVPAVYAWLASTAPDAAVLELPYGLYGGDALAMYYSLYHRRPVVNGFSGTGVSFVEAFANFPDEVSLRALEDAGVRYVITHPDALPGPAMDALLTRIEARTDLNPRWIGSDLVAEIPPAPARAAPVAQAPELDRRRWVLTGSSAGASRAADGDLATHWTTSVDGRDSVLRIDLGTVEAVGGVTLRMGAHAVEYPRTYSIWASEDGSTWRQLGGAPVTLPPFASYRRAHRDVEVPLQMNPGRARYLEIRVPARIAWTLPASWGVHEVQVFAPPAEASPAS
jgi:hypothetical protein